MPRASHRVQGARALRGRLTGSRSERIRIPVAVPQLYLPPRPFEGSGRFHVEHNSGRPDPGCCRAWVASKGAEPGKSGSARSSSGLQLRSPLGRRSAVCQISSPAEHRSTSAAARAQRRAQDLALARVTPGSRMPRGLMQQAASSVQPPEARDTELESGPLRSGRARNPRKQTVRMRCRSGMSACRDVGMGYPGLPRDSSFHVERHASDRSVPPSGGGSRNEGAVRAHATREAQGILDKPRRLR